MKLALPIILAFVFALPAVAQVNVRGYTRKDGTYVAPHIRSSPNGTKADNYGPSSSSPLYSGRGSVTPPSTRDSDRDGIANMYDSDDNNNGRHDDNDRSQYGLGSSYSQPSTSTFGSTFGQPFGSSSPFGSKESAKPFGY